MTLLEELLRAVGAIAFLLLAALIVAALPTLRDVRRARQRGFDLKAWLNGENS